MNGGRRSVVSYARSEEISSEYAEIVKKWIKRVNAKKICDIGGGANPLLSEEYIQSNSLDYTVLDISEEELRKAPGSYSKINADISSRDLRAEGFDFCFSRMVAEHIKDGRQFHENVHRMLNSRGVAIHLFPTLFALPLLINRLIPEGLAFFLLSKFDPGRNMYRNGKFPAYYSWCRGPTDRQIKRLEGLGYNIVEYVGCFGHDYYQRIKVIHGFHKMNTQFLLDTPFPYFTTSAYVVLEKR
ncbi:MAG: class I SAM-dependent methyltransferase [Leptospirales bacterium]